MVPSAFGLMVLHPYRLDLKGAKQELRLRTTLNFPFFPPKGIFKNIYLFILFISLTVLGLSCSTWDLQSSLEHQFPVLSHV